MREIIRFVLIAMFAVNFTVGDWMLHTPGGGPLEERCPCMPKQLCPRMYGTSAADILHLGTLPICMDSREVRCCGVSRDIKMIKHIKGITINENSNSEPLEVKNVKEKENVNSADILVTSEMPTTTGNSENGTIFVTSTEDISQARDEKGVIGKRQTNVETFNNMLIYSKQRNNSSFQNITEILPFQNQRDKTNEEIKGSETLKTLENATVKLDGSIDVNNKTNNTDNTRENGLKELFRSVKIRAAEGKTQNFSRNLFKTNISTENYTSPLNSNARTYPKTFVKNAPTNISDTSSQHFSVQEEELEEKSHSDSNLINKTNSKSDQNNETDNTDETRSPLNKLFRAANLKTDEVTTHNFSIKSDESSESYASLLQSNVSIDPQTSADESVYTLNDFSHPVVVKREFINNSNITDKTEIPRNISGDVSNTVDIKMIIISEVEISTNYRNVRVMPPINSNTENITVEYFHRIFNETSEKEGVTKLTKDKTLEEHSDDMIEGDSSDYDKRHSRTIDFYTNVTSTIAHEANNITNNSNIHIVYPTRDKFGRNTKELSDIRKEKVFYVLPSDPTDISDDDDSVTNKSISDNNTNNEDLHVSEYKNVTENSDDFLVSDSSENIEQRFKISILNSTQPQETSIGKETYINNNSENSNIQPVQEKVISKRPYPIILERNRTDIAAFEDAKTPDLTAQDEREISFIEKRETENYNPKVSSNFKGTPKETNKKTGVLYREDFGDGVIYNEEEMEDEIDEDTLHFYISESLKQNIELLKLHPQISGEVQQLRSARSYSNSGSDFGFKISNYETPISNENIKTACKEAVVSGHVSINCYDTTTGGRITRRETEIKSGSANRHGDLNLTPNIQHGTDPFYYLPYENSIRDFNHSPFTEKILRENILGSEKPNFTSSVNVVDSISSHGLSNSSLVNVTQLTFSSSATSEESDPLLYLPYQHSTPDFNGGESFMKPVVILELQMETESKDKPNLDSLRKSSTLNNNQNESTNQQDAYYYIPYRDSITNFNQ